MKFIKYFNDYIKRLKNEYLEINFVRHAATSLNKKEIFLGTRNNPKIIKIKKKRINKKKFNYVITSNLLRSKMTGKLYHAQKKLTSNLITEIDYGKVDGLTIKQAQKNYPNLFKLWDEGVDAKFPNGENSNDVKKRVKKFIATLKNFKKGEKILIVSHSFFLRVLFSFVLKLDLMKVFKIQVDHLKIFQFLFKGTKLISNLQRTEYYKILRQTYD